MKQVRFVIYIYIKEQSESRTQQRHGIYMTKETIFHSLSSIFHFLDGVWRLHLSMSSMTGISLTRICCTFINYWKLSQHFIFTINIRYINTILHSNTWSKRVFPINVFSALESLCYCIRWDMSWFSCVLESLWWRSCLLESLCYCIRWDTSSRSCLLESLCYCIRWDTSWRSCLLESIWWRSCLLESLCLL
jgi:hypothetical protein